MIILDGVHSGCNTIVVWSLLLTLLVLDWAIRCRMRLTVAETAKYSRTITEQLFGTVLELMALLTTAFAPNPS